ncbi:immunity protein Imm33 domain-containing protein [Paenibacillus sp. CAA11]|uniref:immunity protein Imm33 domain-containing protein n=1 Tax=Paenibacillus sp. CAA11 TaxID=1532905 RepID=UPI0019012809|nr:DUF2185 domain-containing protein [Paenibacillus sp. CAA11]
MWVEITEKDPPGGIVRWMYREEGDHAEDCGWRLISGEEDEEYTDNPGNIVILSVAELIDGDPSLVEPLKGGIGAAYEREHFGESWTRVEDWES